jgi:hypothetical protein
MGRRVLQREDDRDKYPNDICVEVHITAEQNSERIATSHCRENRFCRLATEHLSPVARSEAALNNQNSEYAGGAKGHDIELTPQYQLRVASTDVILCTYFMRK